MEYTIHKLAQSSCEKQFIFTVRNLWSASNDANIAKKKNKKIKKFKKVLAFCK